MCLGHLLVVYCGRNKCKRKGKVLDIQQSPNSFLQWGHFHCAMRGLGTDHVIWGPMRGLKKNAWGMDIIQADRQTDKQMDLSTL